MSAHRSDYAEPAHPASSLEQQIAGRVDRHKKAKTKLKSGQGDKGDR